MMNLLLEVATMNLQCHIHSTSQRQKWKYCFEEYHVASGLAGRGEGQQVSILLYCLREDTEGVLDTTRITNENKKSSQSLQKLF